jgi:hypothetical protein
VNIQTTLKDSAIICLLKQASVSASTAKANSKPVQSGLTGSLPVSLMNDEAASRNITPQSATALGEAILQSSTGAPGSQTLSLTLMASKIQ